MLLQTLNWSWKVCPNGGGRGTLYAAPWHVLCSAPWHAVHPLVPTGCASCTTRVVCRWYLCMVVVSPSGYLGVGFAFVSFHNQMPSGNQSRVVEIMYNTKVCSGLNKWLIQLMSVATCICLYLLPVLSVESMGILRKVLRVQSPNKLPKNNLFFKTGSAMMSNGNSEMDTSRIVLRLCPWLSDTIRWRIQSAAQQPAPAMVACSANSYSLEYTWKALYHHVYQAISFNFAFEELTIW